MDPSYVAGFCTADWKKHRRRFFSYLKPVIDATPVEDVTKLAEALQDICQRLMGLDYKKRLPNDDRNFVNECRRMMRTSFQQRVGDYEMMNIRLQSVLTYNREMAAARKKRGGERAQANLAAPRVLHSGGIEKAVQKLKDLGTPGAKMALVQFAMGCRYKEILRCDVRVEDSSLIVSNHSKQLTVEMKVARLVAKHKVPRDEAMASVLEAHNADIRRPCQWYLFSDNPADGIALFLSLREEVKTQAVGIEPQKLYKSTQRAVKKVFGRKWGTHDLRRLYACYSYFKLKPAVKEIEYTRQILGHKSLDVSMLYTIMHIL